MRFSKWLAVVILLGCQEKAPIGQVVATLPNSKITAKELNYETRLSGVANEQLALEALIDRKVLVQAALDDNIDLDEGFHFSLRRAREELLVEELKKKIAGKISPKLEKEVWIAINQQPWRYKDRMRLYLTRNDENGERTVFWIDTADYEEDLPEAVYEVEVGDVLTLNGQDWNVHLREMLVASPEEMMIAAREDLLSEKIQMETDRIIKNYRQSGQTIYKVGFGPSFIGSNGTDIDK